MSSSTTTTTSPPPSSTEAVRGVWQREFEEDPLGDKDNADRTTLVWWTQAPQSGLYVDLRLPLGSLGRSTSSTEEEKEDRRNPQALQGRGILADSLSDEHRTILLRQKSFAGILHFSWGDTTSTKEAVTNDGILADLANHPNGALPLCTCFWEREIDFRPPTGGLDIGVCASGPINTDGSIDMRETGDDASYAEGWHRLVGSEEGPFFACRLMNESGIDRKGFWVRTGKFFAYAIGRPNTVDDAVKLQCAVESPQIQASVGKTLEEAVMENAWGMDVVGSYVSVCGEVIGSDQDEEIPSWKILHSTDPALVGCDLLGLGSHSCSTLTMDGDLLEGSILNQRVGSDDCIRSWKVIEISDVPRMKEELSL